MDVNIYWLKLDYNVKCMLSYKVELNEVKLLKRSYFEINKENRLSKFILKFI